MDSKFDENVKKTIDEFMERHPLGATYIGGEYHRFDGEMEKGTIEDVEKDIVSLKQSKDTLLSIDENELSAKKRLERQLLMHFSDLQLFQNEELKTWEHGVSAGGGPVGTIGGGLFPLFMRDFAPFEARVQSMISRLRKCPFCTAERPSSQDWQILRGSSFR